MIYSAAIHDKAEHDRLIRDAERFFRSLRLFWQEIRACRRGIIGRNQRRFSIWPVSMYKLWQEMYWFRQEFGEDGPTYMKNGQLQYPVRLRITQVRLFDRVVQFIRET